MTHRPKRMKNDVRTSGDTEGDNRGKILTGFAFFCCPALCAVD